MSTYTPLHGDGADRGGVLDVDRLIRLKEFLRLTGLGRSTVYKFIAQGELERPLRITERTVGWRRVARLRIPLIADTHSSLIADSAPGDRGHPG